MGGTWTQIGPGRSVFRLDSGDDWKIGPDALLPYVNQDALAALERIGDRWDREVWPRIYAARGRVADVAAVDSGGTSGT